MGTNFSLDGVTPAASSQVTPRGHNTEGGAEGGEGDPREGDEYEGEDREGDSEVGDDEGLHRVSGYLQGLQFVLGSLVPLICRPLALLVVVWAVPTAPVDPLCSVLFLGAGGWVVSWPGARVCVLRLMAGGRAGNRERGQKRLCLLNWAARSVCWCVGAVLVVSAFRQVGWPLTTPCIPTPTSMNG